MVRAIDLKSEEVDLKLQKLSLDKFDALSFYSCINGEADQHKRALVVNRLQNVRIKYKILRKHVKEKAKMNGVEMTLRKVMMLVVVDGIIFLSSRSRIRSKKY